MSHLSKTGLMSAVLAGFLAAAPSGWSQSVAVPDGSASGSPAVAPATSIPGIINATSIFTRASYGTGGGGLRNRAGASVGISGVSTPVRTAYLYWAFITNGAPPTAASRVTITRRFPGPTASAGIQGTVIGTGASPCWGGTRTTVYKGIVPASLANGNGLYEVALQSGASGLTTGEDPWNGHVVFPLAEGVSLVVIGTGTKTVGLYDIGLAGHTFGTSVNDTFTYSLRLPTAATSAGATWDNIGADGQSGSGRSQSQSLSGEVTKINGVTIAGTGGIDLDSDWNGGSALPIPQLWDDTGHNITTAARSGTTILNVSVATKTDCLVPVANITGQ